MLNLSSPKLVDIKHKFKMACFNFEHLYQIAVDTRLILILVDSLKYCQNCMKMFVLYLCRKHFKSRWTELNRPLHDGRGVIGNQG